MDHSLLAIVNALSELEEAYRKSDEEVKRVAERRWDILHDPRIMPIIQRRIDTAKSDGEVMECMRMQRFLENAKQQSLISLALAEEQRLYEALKRASSELWSATPSTMSQVLTKHELLFRNNHPFGVYFTRYWHKLHSKSEDAEELSEFGRAALKERRLNANQCLENFLDKGIGFAAAQFRIDFQAWTDKFRLDEEEDHMPRDIDILLQQMSDLMSQHRWQDALQIGQTLLMKLPANDHPKRALVFYNKGVCYNELGQYAEAETQHATAVQEDPSDSDYWYNRANNQHQWAVSTKRRGNITESQTHFQQAMDYALQAKRINPGDRDILNLIALIQRSM